MGLRQQVAPKKPQMYMQKDFDIILPSLSIYLIFEHLVYSSCPVWVLGLFLSKKCLSPAN
jgi:hypothetical protein